MAIPKFQKFFRPLLEVIADGREYSMAEVRDRIAQQMQLSESDLAERLPSGVMTVFTNRVAWAKAYLTRAGLVETPRRGAIKIRPEGKRLLEINPPDINVRYLREQYPAFREFFYGNQESRETETEQGENSSTPQENLERANEELRAELASSILEKIQQNSPKFFEKLVLDLMIALGYGGSRPESGKLLGKSGDEGVDGIINEDKLGLDVIYLQAKRWKGTVGRPEVQRFVGALQGKRARKGVFITTGNFSDEARDYVASIDAKVVLIDGRQLAELMIDHGVGVYTERAFYIKRIDNDYFEIDLE
ncbi:MAG: restriction endonuclease [Turneriella sp.]|nr:restriction endonuclease [Turneriella sp.]